MSIRILIVIECVPPVLVLVLQVDQLFIDILEVLISHILFGHVKTCACVCVDRLILG